MGYDMIMTRATHTDERSTLSDEEKRNEAWRNLVVSLAELSVHTGLVNSVIENYPEQVQENYLERLEMQSAWVNEQIEEVQSFGEAFDEDDEED